MPQVIIANSLADGFVVFLTATHEWSRDIGAAALADTDEQANALLDVANAAASANEVVDPYLITVDTSGNKPRPVEIREWIRATGPTIDIPC